ncbi:hypothetical protein ACP3TJ_06505 [Desulforudis sp. 1088]|uniref:hypothetical protein n=1 Tax=unclassified Candidatus Desulforudis TaxID=2635950 RepID=UPI00346B8F4D
MRTTIEISNEKRAKLLALAARRGLRGYSQLVNEALDAYLAKAEEKRTKDLEEILALAGTLSRAEAEEAEKAIREAWAKWRLS